MTNYVSLKKTGAGWEFENEAALEDFLWTHLQQLLGFIPVKRQYCVAGQYCDILAITENKQLVVLELKNVEDRYIVQQLTRYYHALLEEKPFAEKIDYSLPVILVAITPSFHRDNFIDIQYQKLNFEFLQFSIIENQETLFLQLKDLNTGKSGQLQIPHQKTETPTNIPSPPKALLNMLSKTTPENREILLQVRHQLLSFDERMKETSASGCISYGKGKSKPCAEIRLDTLSDSRLYLWLPIGNRILRMRIDFGRC
jgi:RecB family endonuclease NucS